MTNSWQPSAVRNSVLSTVRPYRRRRLDLQDRKQRRSAGRPSSSPNARSCITTPSWSAKTDRAGAHRQGGTRPSPMPTDRPSDARFDCPSTSRHSTVCSRLRRHEPVRPWSDRGEARLTVRPGPKRHGTSTFAKRQGSRLDTKDRSEGAGFRRFASDTAARRAWNSVRAGLSEVR